MRFLHTSDWHLGRYFHNVSLLDDQAYVLNQLIEIVKDQQLDAVLIAGDLYDRSVPPASAVALLDEILGKICIDLKVPVLKIAGNHDSPDRVSFGSRHFAGSGLHVFGRVEKNCRKVVLEDKYGKVCFYPLPYTDPVTIRGLFGMEVTSFDQAYGCLFTQWNPSFDPLTRSVMLGHLFLDGCESSESERPLSLGGIDKVSPNHFLPFNYTALGHLHGPQFKKTNSIRYSGSILKYSFSEEKHKKSVTIVEMDAKGCCDIQQIPLIPKQNLRILEGRLQDILISGESDAEKNDYLLVRLTDTRAILDIMNKLREVFPNVLHVERPGLMQIGEQQPLRREQLKRGELSLFRDFYLQVKGEELSHDQSVVVEKALETIHRGKES